MRVHKSGLHSGDRGGGGEDVADMNLEHHLQDLCRECKSVFYFSMSHTRGEQPPQMGA